MAWIAAYAAHGYGPVMPIIAAVWGVEAGFGAKDGIVIHPAAADQGPYGAGSPFDAFVVADDRVELHQILAGGARVWAWRVAERVPLVGSDKCEVAMVSLMRRSPRLSHDEFGLHWAERHAPLALRRHVGLADYRQYLVAETISRDTPEIDGVAWLAFATRSDFVDRFFDSDEGRDEILADVARFMDRPRPETTLVRPRGGPGVGG